MIGVNIVFSHKLYKLCLKYSITEIHNFCYSLDILKIKMFWQEALLELRMIKENKQCKPNTATTKTTTNFHSERFPGLQVVCSSQTGRVYLLKVSNEIVRNCGRKKKILSTNIKFENYKWWPRLYIAPVSVCRKFIMCSECFILTL